MKVETIHATSYIIRYIFRWFKNKIKIAFEIWVWNENRILLFIFAPTLKYTTAHTLSVVLLFFFLFYCTQCVYICIKVICYNECKSWSHSCHKINK